MENTSKQITEEKPTVYLIAAINNKSGVIPIFGDRPPDGSDNKSYTVFVPEDCVGMASGTVGSIAGRSILNKQNAKGRRDGFALYTVGLKDYETLETLEAKKSEMTNKSQFPETPPSNLSEEEMNRVEPRKSKRSVIPPRLPKGYTPSMPSSNRGEWKPPAPDIFDLEKPSDRTS